MKGQTNKKNREDKRKEKEQQVSKLTVTVGIFELGFRVFPEPRGRGHMCFAALRLVFFF